MRSILAVGFLSLMALAGAACGGADESRPSPLTVVVMDPLAAPLSCPCVKGYAQRDYDQLGKFLEAQLGKPVVVVYDESLVVALKKKCQGKADLVIGKCSVVRHDAGRAKMDLSQVASLSGKDGLTTQTGLIVVPQKDPAQTVADLKNYRVIFGPEECEEKHAAALALLKKHGVPAPAKVETCASCSDGAVEIIEKGPAAKNATVISSYAAPLLEGCGNIKKGDIRVVGTTEPVPFVGAFVNNALPLAERELLLQALLKAGEEPALLQALETKMGFVRPAAGDGTKKK